MSGMSTKRCVLYSCLINHLCILLPIIYRKLNEICTYLLILVYKALFIGSYLPSFTPILYADIRKWLLVAIQKLTITYCSVRTDFCPSMFPVSRVFWKNIESIAFRNHQAYSSWRIFLSIGRKSAGGFSKH